MAIRLNVNELVNRQSAKPVFSDALIIYGAGNCGRAVAQFLMAKGIHIQAFLDAAARIGQTCLGIPVLTLEQWVEENSPTSSQCLVTIHNRDVFMPLLLEKIQAMRFRDVFTMIDFTNAFPDDQTFRFWLAPSSCYADQQERIKTLLSILEDDESRYLAEATIRFRVTGDYNILPNPSTDDQYLPKGLSRWQEPLRLVDCGAYDGDTIKAFLKAGYRVDAVIAFEPDMNNFQKLTDSFPQLDIINFPCGISSQTQMQRFDMGAGEASRITNIGENMVQCVALDQAIPSFAPNLIKMDIEGSELDALKGAKKLIHRFRPNLAISIYHLAEHLWEVPLLIHGWDIGYRLYIRSHAFNSFDSILYAVQE